VTPNTGGLGLHLESGFRSGEFRMVCQMLGGVVRGFEITSGGKNGTRRDTCDSHTR